MKQKFFTLLALFACVLTASAQSFTLKDVEMVPGSGQYKINLDLAADATFLGASFSINLPEGVTPVMESKELPNEAGGTTEQSVVKCDLSSEFQTAGTYVFSNQVGETNVYKFVVLPTTAAASLKAGTVMSVYVQGPGDVEFPASPVIEGTGKNYPVLKEGSASDIVLAANVSTQLVDVSVPNIAVNFNTYKLGDANGDGGVDVGDANAILNDVVDNTPASFVAVAANANRSEDGVEVGDANKVLNFVVGNINVMAPQYKAPEVDEEDQINEPD